MTHTKRERDLIIRNGRPTKQQRLDMPTRAKRRMPDRRETVTIKYRKRDLDKLDHIKEIIKRWNLKAELVQVD